MLNCRLGRATIRIYDTWRTVETAFDDGQLLIASPEDNDAYRATAHRLGYGTDTWRMCVEHELLHSVTAAEAGLPWCYVLHGVATGVPTLPPVEIGIVESVILERQRELCDMRRGLVSS